MVGDLPELAQRSPERALELHAKLPKGDGQYGYGYSAAQSIFLVWAQTDPVGAAARAMQSLGKRQAALNIVSQLAEANPKAAAEFALNLPTGGAQTSALSSVATSWAQKDPKAAAQ